MNFTSIVMNFVFLYRFYSHCIIDGLQNFNTQDTFRINSYLEYNNDL